MNARMAAPVLMISLGGALGSLVRFGLGEAFPASPDRFPWTTFAINVAGCLLIGVIMVLGEGVWAQRRLVRPFLGVGVLGGFTTFSTYAVDIQHLVVARAAGTGLLYLVGTVVAALWATYTGMIVTRWVHERLRPAGQGPAGQGPWI